MTQFIKNNTGLKSIHKDENPLFEKTYTPPDYGNKLISRLYSDGSLYYLNLERKKKETQISEEEWNFIAQISSESVNVIKQELNNICEKNSFRSDEGLSKGEFVWKVNCNSEVLHFHFFGLQQSKGLNFSAIDEIINKG